MLNYLNMNKMIIELKELNKKATELL